MRKTYDAIPIIRGIKEEKEGEDQGLYPHQLINVNKSRSELHFVTNF